MNSDTSPQPSVSTQRNKVAAALSLIPGLGHIYKHHYVFGLGLMFVGIPLTLWVAVLLTLATLGLSVFLVPLCYWAAVAYDASQIDDWQHGRPAKPV